MNENSPGNIIRITKEEATSGHVDDMLKRQMSMRGDPGVTRDRRRKWYFQNWLLFALAGGLGALVAWAIIEPFFDDEVYVQGPVTDLDLSDGLGDRVSDGNREVTLRMPTEGSFKIHGEKIYLMAGVHEIDANGRTRRLDLKTLREGATVGVYSEYLAGARLELAIARFVVRDPPPQSKARAQMTMGQLASRSGAAGMLLFPLVAGMIGLFVGSADGLVCRLPRRALLSGAVGLLVGCVGGLVCSLLANLAYAPVHELAQRQAGAESATLNAFGFVLQTVGRALAWCLAGTAMGLGQGIALRSPRLLIYGLIGGILGGLFGGMLFDPVDLILLGADKPSAHWSRLIGFMVIGASVGGMIGLVELLARDAWLRMTQGPLTGKEFLLFKDVMAIGSSPRSDIYLFNDAQVAKQHAVIRAMGDECEIEARDSAAPVLLNNRPVQRARLRHGDNVTIGRTAFVFQRRKG
jgi:hypothetical protein